MNLRKVVNWYISSVSIDRQGKLEISTLKKIIVNLIKI